jgi:glycosyltransferase involved in cell wall biosynthesis
MRIGIEATILHRTHRTGVDNYAHFLTRAMAARDPESEFIYAYLGRPNTGEERDGESLGNITTHHNAWMPIKVYNGLYRYLIAPPFDLLTGTRCDVFLFPNFVRWPLRRRVKSALIVHDLSYIHAQEYMTARLRTFLARKVPESIERSDLVITISQSSRRQILERYHTPTGKVVVAYPAVNPRIFHPYSEWECSDVLARYRLGWKNYILFAGTVEPRKNIETLIDAYEMLDARQRKEFPLVIAGKSGWLDDGIKARIEESRRIGCGIFRLGYVPLSELPMVYSGAALFTFPSRYEGFGMPPLEAMACGTPVIVANNSSLPEVVGDHGVLVDAGDAAGLARVMGRLLDDADARQRLATDGLRHARAFSWEQSAATVLNAIKSL